MENKINFEEVSKIGDAILTAYVNGDYQEAASLWCSFARIKDEESVRLLHRYENPSITDVSFAMALVESVQKKNAWKGKKLRSKRDFEKVKGELFWIETITWENHEETTRRRWSEADYSQFLTSEGTFRHFTRYDHRYRYEE